VNNKDNLRQLKKNVEDRKRDVKDVKKEIKAIPAKIKKYKALGDEKNMLNAVDWLISAKRALVEYEKQLRSAQIAYDLCRKMNKKGF